MVEFDPNKHLEKLQEFVATNEDNLLCAVLIQHYGPDFVKPEVLAELAKTKKFFFKYSVKDDLVRICYRIKEKKKEMLGYIKFSSVNEKIVVDKVLFEKPVVFDLKHEF